MIKRVFDIILSFVVILLFLPSLILISLLILILNGRPIFFIHKRIGKNFKKIGILKFRTMSNSRNFSSSFDLLNQERVTVLGKFLRKYKLDELPQFINVFKGDLSIVGPRPEVEKWINKNVQEWEIILSVRPGLTDLASIKFSDEEELLYKAKNPEDLYENEILPAKINLYKEYVYSNNIFTDIMIIHKTVNKIIFK